MKFKSNFFLLKKIYLITFVICLKKKNDEILTWFQITFTLFYLLRNVFKPNLRNSISLRSFTQQT